MRQGSRAGRLSGFSLIELVIVLAMSSLALAALAGWLQGPLGATLEQRERSEALAQSRRVFERLGTELAGALPSSVRVGCGGRCLEYLPVVATGVYRMDAPPGAPLRPGETQDHFDLLAPLPVAPVAGLWAIVNAQSADAAAPYGAYASGSGTVRAQLVSGGSPTRIAHVAHSFPVHSPSRRVDLVGGAVSWLCAPGARTLRRREGYGIVASPPQNPAVGALIADRVIDCRFAVDAAGLVSAELVFDAGGGQPLTLFGQFHPGPRP